MIRKAGALPLDPDGVPPLSLALRGGSLPYYPRRAVNSINPLTAKASLGTDKMGSGAYGPSGVQGQSPRPYSPKGAN